MEFSIKLTGWVLDDPVFHWKKIFMVLNLFILPEMHFKANLFFPIMTPPPNPPHHSPRGSHKGEKQVDIKIHF